MAIVKILKIEGANISWSCKQIKKMIKDGSIKFDNIIQRSYVWEILRRSELIWSIIMGYPIPPLYAKRGKTGNVKIKIYDILDGQQRLMTIFLFLTDEFALSENLLPIPYLDENDEEQTLDISGKKFSELEEEIQDAILDKMFTIYYYDTLEQAQQAEMFRRLNNGKPLSSKAKTLANCKDIASIMNIGSHKLFSNIKDGGMLSDNAIKNKNQVAIIMKIWCMLHQDIKDVSFEGKVFNPMLQNTIVSDKDKLEMAQIFNYIVETHDAIVEKKKKSVAKKLYTETHLVSLIPYFKKSLEDGIEADMMADWIIDFFTNVTEDYNAACNGSAKPASIQARHSILEASYKEFFKVEIEESEEQDGDDNIQNGSIVGTDVNDGQELDYTDDNDEPPQTVRSLVDELLEELENKKEEDEE